MRGSHDPLIILDLSMATLDLWSIEKVLAQQWPEKGHESFIPFVLFVAPKINLVLLLDSTNNFYEFDFRILSEDEFKHQI